MFLKIGLDIHGCIDKYPHLFERLSADWVRMGNEVHIITGNMKTPEIVKQLAEWKISYTHFYSVSDDLLAKGKATHWTSPNDPWFHADDWNPAKAKYCRDNQIDIHYDDSDEYGKHFTTPFVKVF